MRLPSETTVRQGEKVRRKSQERPINTISVVVNCGRPFAEMFMAGCCDVALGPCLEAVSRPRPWTSSPDVSSGNNYSPRYCRRLVLDIGAACSHSVGHVCASVPSYDYVRGNCAAAFIFVAWRVDYYAGASFPWPEAKYLKLLFSCAVKGDFIITFVNYILIQSHKAAISYVMLSDITFIRVLALVDLLALRWS